jgi:transposase
VYQSDWGQMGAPAQAASARSARGAARARETSTGDRPLYALRQGIEGTLSQAVRCFGLRCARYLAKAHLQHVATAAALDRIAAWLQGRPLAPTRISRFAALTA